MCENLFFIFYFFNQDVLGLLLYTLGLSVCRPLSVSVSLSLFVCLSVCLSRIFSCGLTVSDGLYLTSALKLGQSPGRPVMANTCRLRHELAAWRVNKMSQVTPSVQHDSDNQVTQLCRHFADSES